MCSPRYFSLSLSIFALGQNEAAVPRLICCIDPASPCAYWFSFRITNIPVNTTLTFEVCNITKDRTLFNKGGLPYVQTNSVWNTINGSSSHIKTMVESDSISAWNTEYTLRFSHHFPTSPCESAIFAPMIPYSYTDLTNDLQFFGHQARLLKLGWSRKVLGEALGGVRVVEAVHVRRGEGVKKVVVLSCRVHPSETVSSWVLRGLLLFLCSDDEDSRRLLEVCEFWILPMLNPEGVANGWFRGNKTSRDLNREWDKPSSPTIFAGTFDYR